MRIFLLLATTIILSFTMNVQAQTIEDVKAMHDLYTKLAGQKAPADCGVSLIDVLVAKSQQVATTSTELTPALEALYYRANGITSEGVKDASAVAPSIDECKAVAEKITTQVKDIKALGVLLPPATAQLKDAKITQKVKAVKSLNYAKDVIATLTEQSVAQGKIIASIMETITKGKK